MGAHWRPFLLGLGRRCGRISLGDCSGAVVMSDLKAVAEIGLDVMAFFFVTIDLYGKQRLEAAGRKIRKLTSEPLFNVRRGTPRSGPSANAFLIVVALLVAGAELPRLVLLPWGIIDPPTSPMAKAYMMMQPADPIFFGGAILVLLAQLWAFVGWLFVRLRLEGVLLGIGTALFLISRGLALSAALE